MKAVRQVRLVRQAQLEGPHLMFEAAVGHW